MGKFNELYQQTNLINESFNANQATKAMKLIKSYLTKKLGKLYKTDVQEFTNKFGDQIGIRYAIGNTTQEVRFNWISSGGSSEIASVDIWDGSTNATPTIHIDTKDVSVVKVLPELVFKIKNPTTGDVPLVSESEELSEVKKVPMAKIIARAEKLNKEYENTEKNPNLNGSVAHIMDMESMIKRYFKDLKPRELRAKAHEFIKGTVKESVNESLNESSKRKMYDLKLLIDQLANSMEYYDEADFVKYMTRETEYDASTLKKIFNAYWDLDPIKRDNMFNKVNTAKSWLNKFGINESLNEAKIKVGSKVYKSGKDAITDLYHSGHTPDQIQQMTGLSTKVVNYHSRQALKAVGGVPEKAKKTKSEADAEKQVDELKYADPDIIYQDLQDLITLVVTAIQPSLIITGGAGTGKTFTVKKLLKDAGMERGNDWKLIKGQTTPKGLYASLFLNRDKIIVFDDTDSIWKDKVAVNILKAALDSDDERLISWQSSNTYDADFPPYDELPGLSQYDQQRQYFQEQQKLPNEFLFEGQIIFLSNLHESQLDQAVKNRSYYIDVTLSPDDVIKRVQSIIPNFKINDKQVPKADQLEAFEAFKDITKTNKGYISIRTFIQFLKTKASGSPRWKELALKYSS